ncbi:hypothetical protein CBM2598_U40035 [Cupriavidus taiwanensis]|nr:hypothetical protein CBM2598_U40035 [Cupriavidus taiwanensis]
MRRRKAYSLVPGGSPDGHRYYLHEKVRSPRDGVIVPFLEKMAVAYHIAACSKVSRRNVSLAAEKLFWGNTVRKCTKV